MFAVTKPRDETLVGMDARSRFEGLVRDHQSAVCAVAYAIVRDRARSEELAQDAFLTAWRHRDRVPVVTVGWICAIARNLARNAARRRAEVAMETEPATGTNARDELIDREDQARAIAALAELPEPYREAIVLYYRGDESMATVAGALGVSEATARQRVHRGRAKLRDALRPVVTALGRSRPGTAFTAMVVAAWLAGRAPTAGADDAVPASVGAAVATSWIVAALSGAVASIAIVVGVAVASTHDSDAPVVTQPADVRAADARVVQRARFPAPLLPAPVPAKFRAVDFDVPASSATVDLDFANAPVDMMLKLMALQIDAPIWLDPAIEGTVDIRATKTPAMDALDEVLAQVGAVRTEVAAIEVVAFGGRTDASTLGGDLMSLRLRAAPLDAALSAIESKLYMPIGRLALPEPLPCQPGLVIEEGQEVNVQCASPTGDPSPRVTIDVHDLPAGAVLEQVLVQTGLGYEHTTGFAVTPD